MAKPQVGVYARLSQDRYGKSESTKRQIESCHQYAQAKGWKVVEIFEDKDVSAYALKTKRPAYERMLQALKGGTIDGVVVWKLDRLLRRSREWHRFWEVCEHGIFASVNEAFDTSTPMGMAMVQICAAFAELESATISLRVRAAHDANAAQGNWNGGGKRPFGLSADRKSIVAREAKLTREAAQLVIEGQSLRSIANDWNQRGITTTLGNQWHGTTLRQVLDGVWITGHREHSGKIIKASWPAILDEVTAKKVWRIIRNPNRLTHDGTGRVHMLSGIIECECGNKMRAHGPAGGGKRYSCEKRPGDPHCGSCAINAEPVDRLVTEWVFHRLDSPQFRKVVERTRRSAKDRDLLKKLKDDEEALEELADDYYVVRSITKAQFFRAKQALERRIEEASRRLARPSQDDVLLGLGTDDEVRKRWEAETPLWRHELLKLLIDAVIIRKVGRGNRTGKIGQPVSLEAYSKRIKVKPKA